MNIATFLLILTGVLLNGGAQLLLKAGTNATGVINIVPGQILALFFSVATQPFIIAGVGCYVISVSVWIAALSRVDVSLAYPMLSIAYVFNAFAAWYLFGEALSPSRLAGIGVIILGVFILYRS